MNKEQLLAGNKIIADFRKQEYQPLTNGDYDLFDYRNNPIDYSTDWELLMAVVEHIEKEVDLGLSFSIEVGGCDVFRYRYSAYAYRVTSFKVAPKKITAVWEATVDCITFITNLKNEL